MKFKTEQEWINHENGVKKESKWEYALIVSIILLGILTIGGSDFSAECEKMGAFHYSQCGS